MMPDHSERSAARRLAARMSPIPRLQAVVVGAGVDSSAFVRCSPLANDPLLGYEALI